MKAHLDELIGVWKDMEENRNSVQDKMMERYDKNYRELKGMKKGQLVMVEAKHISVPAKRVKGVMDNEKLQPRYFGPYAIAAWHNGSAALRPQPSQRPHDSCVSKQPRQCIVGQQGGSGALRRVQPLRRSRAGVGGHDVILSRCRGSSVVFAEPRREHHHAQHLLHCDAQRWLDKPRLP